MSSEEDVEETIIEYARFHGLASDCLTEPLPQSHIEKLHQNSGDTLTDDSDLKQVEYRPIPKLEERLTVDKGAALLIAGASGGFLDQKAIEKTIRDVSGAPKLRRLKIELPLLKTDPDVDFAAFRQQNLAPIEDGKLIYEPIDDEKDEGLQWPSDLTSFPGNILKDCSSERFEVLKETLVYMQITLKDNWSNQDRNELLSTQSSHKRKTTIDPVTPPLSPRFWCMAEPFVPSSPDCYLPLQSDPASLLGADIEAVEKAVFKGDAFSALVEGGCNSISSSDDYRDEECCDPRNTFGDYVCPTSDELLPAVGHERPENMKVETPLTPPFPMSKTVTFSNFVEEIMLLDQEYADSASSLEVSGKADSFFIEGKSYDVFKEALETANRNIEQEQLQEAATTKKVDVPVMDFVTPEPPWKALEHLRFADGLVQAQNLVISAIKEEHGFKTCEKGLRRLDNSVGWTVFPSGLAKVALIEEFGDEEDFLKYIISSKISDVVSSTDVTYKTPGLRILRHSDSEDEDEEELESGIFTTHEPENIASLLGKRKLQLAEGEIQKHLHGSDGSNISKAAHLSFRKSTSKTITNFVTTGKMLVANTDDEKELIGGPFSAAMAVDNFMEMRGTKKQKLTDSKFFASSKVIPIPGPQSIPIGPIIASSRAMKADLPLPLTRLPTTATPFIIATQLLKNRPLIKAVKLLFPTAHLVERDFNKHNMTAWTKPGTITRSPIVSSLAVEADLILSPSTGAILTSLTKIKQKPLPGQKSKVEIRERVEAVSKRYERLLVFVSEASLDESSCGLNGQDCMALAEFMGFCGSLPTSISVLFVPGGHQTLAKWLVSAMVQHGIHDAVGAGLLEDETVWELFLRRCGMNSYAAQAVASALKAPEGVNQESPSKRGIFGISAFVGMDPNERVRRFRAILDGERVLGRVSRVIDTQWRHQTP